MKEILIISAIGFTVVTLMFIVIYGHFNTWTDQITNRWGIVVGISIALNIIYSRFIKKRKK